MRKLPVIGNPSTTDRFEPELTRRSFLRTGAAAVSGMAALAAALSPLREFAAEDMPNLDQFLQKHYKEMTAAEMEQALERIRDKVEERYRIRPHLRDIKPMEGVELPTPSISRAASAAASAYMPAWRKTTSRAVPRFSTFA